jgi:hypothetical protein
MTNSVDENARPHKPLLNIHIPLFLRSRDSCDDLADYHQNILLKNIALNITSLTDADSQKWCARELQRGHWKLLGLDEPCGQRFDGPPEPHYDENRIYWYVHPIFWPDEKPFELKMEILTMQEKLTAAKFVRPEVESIVARNFQFLKQLLRLSSLEEQFLTGAWCVSRTHASNIYSPLSQALHICRHEFVEPCDVAAYRATVLSKLLGSTFEQCQSLVGRIREFVCLGFISEDRWHGDAATTLFDLMCLENIALELLETYHESIEDIEKSILAFGNFDDRQDLPTQEKIIADVLSDHKGPLRTAYLCAAMGEPLDAMSISEIVNRITGLSFGLSQMEALAERVRYSDIVLSAIRAALKCRKRSCPINQFEFCRELFFAARGLDLYHP